MSVSFEPVPPGTPTEVIYARVPADLAAQVKVTARRFGLPQATIVRYLLAAGLQVLERGEQAFVARREGEAR